MCLIGHGNNTYCKAHKSYDEIIDEKQNILNLWILKLQKKKTLPIIYWIPIIRKNPTSAHFITASKICSTKQISESVFIIFKLGHPQIENVYKNAKFL